jgi:RHS repeat-associated protein
MRTVSTGSLPLAAYGFSQKERDRETGLQYFDARYLADHLARFVSVDPVAQQIPGEVLANPQLLNAYAYSRNNPVTYIDPTGEISLIKAIRAVPRGIQNDVKEFKRGKELAEWIKVATALPFCEVEEKYVAFHSMIESHKTLKDTIKRAAKDEKKAKRNPTDAQKMKDNVREIIANANDLLDSIEELIESDDALRAKIEGAEPSKLEKAFAKLMRKKLEKPDWRKAISDAREQLKELQEKAEKQVEEKFGPAEEQFQENPLYED